MSSKLEKFFKNFFCSTSFDMSKLSRNKLFYKKNFPLNKFFCIKNTSKVSALFYLTEEKFEDLEKDIKFDKLIIEHFKSEIIIGDNLQKNYLPKKILNVNFIILSKK